MTEGSLVAAETATKPDPPSARTPKPAVWPAAATLVAFAICCRIRMDIAVGLVILGTVWTALERWRPVHAGPPALRRRGAMTDVAHFVIDEILAAAGVVAVVFVARPFVDAGMPDVVPRALQSQPGWALWFEAMVLAEVFGYWGHRFEHEIPLLWRFHRVHHSSPTMDWLAPNRRHPVDMTFSRVSVALPMFALGFGLPAVVGAFVIRRFQGLFVHANWNVRLGPLEWVFATPHFHHWHHADHPEAVNTNYAGQSMLVDKVFGTLYRPAGWPERYGCDGVTPDEGYWAQLASPWHRANRPPRAGSLDALSSTEISTLVDLSVRPAAADPRLARASRHQLTR